MKVIKKAVKEVYRLKCLWCKSELEAEDSDVEWSEDVSDFGYVTCPICGKKSPIVRYKHRVVIYED